MSNLVAIPSRFYTENEFWFFRTRESVNIGPFDTIEAARAGLNEYLSFAATNPKQFSKWFGPGRVA
ncbi:DUF6316 family protein [Umboniibacter marinipuniceus]|uniref:DUF6316 domain-containing protein n=1 Tax=Umboniibacter marinipuniceus TaxID=569599 RepID=A0A3M0A7J7_9GAMM|nr:DUF6316 family protein [Umboniibacter marinipuniceus]RMA80264.1 hypothetical protein DFR27_1628 [Umboniibacter marinipuniceus]